MLEKFTASAWELFDSGNYLVRLCLKIFYWRDLEVVEINNLIRKIARNHLALVYFSGTTTGKNGQCNKVPQEMVRRKGSSIKYDLYEEPFRHYRLHKILQYSNA